MQRALDESQALQRAGKLKFIGASIKAVDVTLGTLQLCHQYINTGHVNALQVVYSILRQRHKSMFEDPYQKGVAIVACTAMESGYIARSWS